VTGLRAQGLPVCYLSSSVVVVGVEDRPPLGDLGRALRHRSTLVLRGHPGVPPWLPHEGLANGEGGFGVVQGTAWLRYVLETVHDMIGGDSVCDGDSFAVFQPHPHARPGSTKEFASV